MSGTISGTDLLGRLSHDAQQELAEGEASVHHLTGKNEAVRLAWYAIGIASVRLRNEAMRLAGANQPAGMGYNRYWKALANTKPGLRDLDRRDRAHAMWLAEHWSMVVAWLPSLGNVAHTLLHPTSIMRRYQEAHTETQPAVTNTRAAAKGKARERETRQRKEVYIAPTYTPTLTFEEQGFPPRETWDEPDEDRPGLTKFQGHVAKHGHVHIMPLKDRQAQDARIAARKLSSQVRGLVKPAAAFLASEPVDLAVLDATLDAMPKEAHIVVKRLADVLAEIAEAQAYLTELARLIDRRKKAAALSA